MVLAANVLNAIGGEPRVAGAEHAPRYPHELPDGVVMDLLPFSPQAVEAFLTVENPGHSVHTVHDPHDPMLGGRRHAHHVSKAVEASTGPTTIGEFYAEIGELMTQTAEEIGEAELFCGDPARQVTREYYYAGGGASITVSRPRVRARRARGDRRAGRGRHALDVRRRRRPRALLPLPAAQVRAAPTCPADDAGVPSGRAGRGRLRGRLPDARQPAQRATTPIPSCWPSSDTANRAWSQLLVQLERVVQRRAGRSSCRPCTACSASATRCSSCSPTRSRTIRGATPGPPSSGCEPQ